MDLFLNGACWLRADFHLHTIADGKFNYIENADFFYSNYVDALIKAGIHIGVITNHNKFHVDEFKALRKTALSKDVFLLPGMEFSANDGANGIHILIVFSDDWLNDGDLINQFLSVAFIGKTPSQYENRNGRSCLDIINTIRKLEDFQKDFFFIFAHVEQSSGLWNELDGGRLLELGENELFRRYTLGFQKVRTHDKSDKKCRTKVKHWLGETYPAEIEGSDPTSIEEIGKGKPCFLKIGAFTYEAVKFALIDHKNRLCLKHIPEYTHSYIKKIRFEGGTLGGHTIHFSPELNTLIGIRGSGKSSVLEAIRYVLNHPIDINDSDAAYKNRLVGRTLGSGGKVILDTVDRHGQTYEIQRIWKEDAHVYFNGKIQPGLSINETILSKPLFFGQKELAASGKESEKDLIEKLLGTKCDDIRCQIDAQKIKVNDAVDRFSRVNNVDELILEQTAAKQDAEHRLNFYKKHNIEERLKIRLGFDEDICKAEQGIALVENFVIEIADILKKHEDALRKLPSHSSISNMELLQEFDAAISRIIKTIENMKEGIEKDSEILILLKNKHKELLDHKTKMADEFAAIERSLAEELKVSKDLNINTEGFLAAKAQLRDAETSLGNLSRDKNQKSAFQYELFEALQQLNDLWHREFQIIQAELEKVSQKNVSLKFSVGFKEDKDAFLEFFQTIFKGCSLRTVTLQPIVEKYQDFIGIFEDFENVRKAFKTNSDVFVNHFLSHLKELLTYKPPNRFTIKYRDTELAHHSLGQRASALILFVLGQRENDVIIIDQPEDDLDNQTIYEDVIKLIRELKPSVQFIFATHNPNIPVLGDAEQIHGCSYTDDNIDVQSGSLDNTALQKRIVNIMEGGQEAFNRRNEIYKTWKP